MDAPGDNLRKAAAQSPEARIEELRRQIEALSQADPALDRAQQIVAQIVALRSKKQRKPR